MLGNTRELVLLTWVAHAASIGDSVMNILGVTLQTDFNFYISNKSLKNKNSTNSAIYTR